MAGAGFRAQVRPGFVEPEATTTRRPNFASANVPEETARRPIFASVVVILTQDVRGRDVGERHDRDVDVKGAFEGGRGRERGTEPRFLRLGMSLMRLQGQQS